MAVPTLGGCEGDLWDARHATFSVCEMFNADASDESPLHQAPQAVGLTKVATAFWAFTTNSDAPIEAVDECFRVLCATLSLDLHAPLLRPVRRPRGGASQDYTDCPPDIGTRS